MDKWAMRSFMILCTSLQVPLFFTLDTTLFAFQLLFTLAYIALGVIVARLDSQMYIGSLFLSILLLINLALLFSFTISVPIFVLFLGALGLYASSIIHLLMYK